MIFTNVKIVNMFGIREVDMELTYQRKTTSSPISQSLSNYNKINYKKINIIVGGNASGKTSIGKSLCFIQNFLNGRTINNNSILFKNSRYMPDEVYGFDIEFIINDFIYFVKTRFESDNLFSELWKRVAISKYDSIATLREKLNEVDEFHIYNKNSNDSNEESNPKYIFDLKSSFLSSTKYQDTVKEVRENQVFSYRYSRERQGNSIKEIDLDFFTNVLKAFDPSIKRVRKSLDNDKELIIDLANGATQRIHEDSSVEEYSFLSAGTKEAIELVEILYYIKNSDQGIFFIDEQLAYSHSDLENAVIDLILQWIDKKDTQVFFTTHNKEVLDIGLPPFNYMFTRKYNDRSSIEIIHPEYEVIHKNRSLKGVVKEDIFSISPNIESLLEVIE